MCAFLTTSGCETCHPKQVLKLYIFPLWHSGDGCGMSAVRSTGKAPLRSGCPLKILEKREIRSWDQFRRGSLCLLGKVFGCPTARITALVHRHTWVSSISTATVPTHWYGTHRVPCPGSPCPRNVVTTVTGYRYTTAVRCGQSRGNGTGLVVPVAGHFPAICLSHIPAVPAMCCASCPLEPFCGVAIGCHAA